MFPTDDAYFPAETHPRRPVSERKLAANRANAKKSTGPRTPRGKARSRLNALTHGLTAERLLPNESRRSYERFAREMREDLRPRGLTQVMLAERVIEAAWKLRRADRAQAEVVRRLIARHAVSESAGAGDEPETPSKPSTPATLLAQALADEPQAQAYLKADEYAERLQRSFFTALRRFLTAKRVQWWMAGEAKKPLDVLRAGTGVTRESTGGCAGGGVRAEARVTPPH